MNYPRCLTSIVRHFTLCIPVDPEDRREERCHMTDLFPGDRYDSAPDFKRPFREYLLLGSRWAVYSFFFSVVLKSNALARKNRYDDEAWAHSSLDVIKGQEKCGAIFHISGLETIGKLEGPAVFIANHMGTLETLILPGLICPKRRVTYIVKEKLVRGSVWGPIMRSRDPIVVSRKDPRADLEVVLRKGQELLSKGISIIVFPQGTRMNIFDRSQFNSLGIKLAAKANVPVVPIALKTDFWGNSKIFRGFGPIHRDRPIYIEFGDAIKIEGRGKAEHEQTLEFIESRLRSWGAEVV